MIFTELWLRAVIARQNNVYGPSSRVLTQTLVVRNSEASLEIFVTATALGGHGSINLDTGMRVILSLSVPRVIRWYQPQATKTGNGA